MVHIESVDVKTECTVVARIMDAPEMAVQYTRPVRMMTSDRLTIRYKLSESGQSWITNYVQVSGSRILKPGPNGEQRIGKDFHRNDWTCYLSGDFEASLPEWVAALVDQLRPTGEVDVPF